MCTVKYFSHVFATQNGPKHNDLLPVPFNYTVQSAIKQLQAKYDCCELNATHQLLVCATYKAGAQQMQREQLKCMFLSHHNTKH
jgi:hypothetical protein